MGYNYAIGLLHKELCLIDKALHDLKAWDNYPEAYKRQDKKRKALTKAINHLKQYENS